MYEQRSATFIGRDVPKELARIVAQIAASYDQLDLLLRVSHKKEDKTSTIKIKSPYCEYQCFIFFDKVTKQADVTITRIVSNIVLSLGRRNVFHQKLSFMLSDANGELEMLNWVRDYMKPGDADEIDDAVLMHQLSHQTVAVTLINADIDRLGVNNVPWIFARKIEQGDRFIAQAPNLQNLMHHLIGVKAKGSIVFNEGGEIKCSFLHHNNAYLNRIHLNVGNYLLVNHLGFADFVFPAKFSKLFRVV